MDPETLNLTEFRERIKSKEITREVAQDIFNRLTKLIELRREQIATIEKLKRFTEHQLSMTFLMRKELRLKCKLPLDINEKRKEIFHEQNYHRGFSNRR